MENSCFSRHVMSEHRMSIPQCDISEAEKMMLPSYQPHPPLCQKQEVVPTDTSTVTRPYVQREVGGVIRPVIPEYNILTQDQAYSFTDDDKPCAYIYQGNTHGGYTLTQHVYESPTFKRKAANGVQQLNAADFNNTCRNNNTTNMTNT